MLKIINDLPPNVLGVTAEGKITGKDYETVLIPAVEEKLQTNKKIRMLYDLGKDYTGFDFSAMIDDAKIGFKHLTSWDRIALVSDHPMINSFAKFYGLLFFCKLYVFSNADLDKAKKWISGD
jgi:hypothetical protein